MYPPENDNPNLEDSRATSLFNRYNKLTEQYKGLLANKDEELKGIKTWYMYML